MEQRRKSVKLTPDQRRKLKAAHKENGYYAISKDTGVKHSTLYNILNKGKGREDHIEAIVSYLN